MGFFKKTITLKINIFALCAVLVLLIGIAAAIHFHVPENLFFKLLSPSHIETAEFRLSGRQGYAYMTEQETAATVAILNQVRITDESQHSLPPSSEATAECRLHLKWGATLYINASSGITINEYALSGNSQQADNLYLLLRDLKQAYKQQ